MGGAFRFGGRRFFQHQRLADHRRVVLVVFGRIGDGKAVEQRIGFGRGNDLGPGSVGNHVGEVFLNLPAQFFLFLEFLGVAFFLALLETGEFFRFTRRKGVFLLCLEESDGLLRSHPVDRRSLGFGSLRDKARGIGRFPGCRERIDRLPAQGDRPPCGKEKKQKVLSDLLQGHACGRFSFFPADFSSVRNLPGKKTG